MGVSLPQQEDKERDERIHQWETFRVVSKSKKHNPGKVSRMGDSWKEGGEQRSERQEVMGRGRENGAGGEGKGQRERGGR